MSCTLYACMLHVSVCVCVCVCVHEPCHRGAVACLRCSAAVAAALKNGQGRQQAWSGFLTPSPLVFAEAAAAVGPCRSRLVPLRVDSVA